MGDVKEAVKGSKKISPKLTEGNLMVRMKEMREEVGDLVQKKDEDTLNEGKAAEPENVRKASTLRAVSSLLRSAERLLEDY